MRPISLCSLISELICVVLVTSGTTLIRADARSSDISVATLEKRQAPAVVATSQFLRRAYHASTVVGNRLYIDGGQFSSMSNGAAQYNYSNSLLSVDLDKDWTNSSVSISSISKPDGVPNLNYPSLWYDSDQLLYLGFTGSSSSFDLKNTPATPSQSLWTFKPNDAGSSAWKQIINPDDAIWNSTARPIRGYQAFGDGSAYVLGGSTGLSNSSDLLSGMIQFDMGAKSFSNISASKGATGPGNAPAYQGAMQYVPNFGPGGLFISMGGMDNNGLIDFGTVLVYDPAGGGWYNQTTTGSKPTARVNFCAAGVASTNNTYEIFIYAGDSGSFGPSSADYDTISILTLPAFRWISVPSTSKSPRSGHTCNSVGGSQILVIGGVDANPHTSTGSQEIITKSSFSSPDPFAQGLGIFDMQSLTWANGYTSGGANEYSQSQPVIDYYKQANGNYQSTLLPNVATLMKNSHFSMLSSGTGTGAGKNSDSIAPTEPSASATASPKSSSSTSPGKVAGGVIGGIAALALLSAAVFLLLRRRRTQQGDRKPKHQANSKWNSWAQEKDGSSINAAGELDATTLPPEMGGGFWAGEHLSHEMDGSFWGEKRHEMDGGSGAKRHEMDAAERGGGGGWGKKAKGFAFWGHKHEMSGGEVAREIG